MGEIHWRLGYSRCDRHRTMVLRRGSLSHEWWPYRQFRLVVPSSELRVVFAHQLYPVGIGVDGICLGRNTNWLYRVFLWCSNVTGSSVKMTANNALERTVKHRGPRLAAARSSWPAAQLGR